MKVQNFLQRVIPGTRLRPVLVTGVPRSGTTWLARELAASPGAALLGREPMNPRGSQYGLGGTLDRWTALGEPSKRQERELILAYRGLNPRVYGRYGVRQWSAAWPGTRIIVKDPFAALSIPAIVRVTEAVPVLAFRHPGAILSSYQRMGWTADLSEICQATGIPMPNAQGVERSKLEAWRMAHFWTIIHQHAIKSLQGLAGALVVSHETVAASGPSGLRNVQSRLSLPETRHLRSHQVSSLTDGTPDAGRLHNFDRKPQDVAGQWRQKVTDGELAAMESIAGPTLATLEAMSLGMPIHDVPEE